MEASLTYVRVDVPLIPEASLKLDRLDCSGTDRCAAERRSVSVKHVRTIAKREWTNKARSSLLFQDEVPAFTERYVRQPYEIAKILHDR